MGTGWQLKIMRMGGMLPTLRPTVVHSGDALDAATRQAVLAFMGPAGVASAPARPAPHPEAMGYLLELLQDGQVTQQRRCPFAAVPEGLRPLLPR